MAHEKVTDEELADIIRDAEWTRDRVGAPGCDIRKRAAATLRLVEELKDLRSWMRETFSTR
jgi:hypothetical protein